MTTESENRVKGHVKTVTDTHCEEELGLATEAIVNEMELAGVPIQNRQEKISALVGEEEAAVFKSRFIFC